MKYDGAGFAFSAAVLVSEAIDYLINGRIDPRALDSAAGSARDILERYLVRSSPSAGAIIIGADALPEIAKHPRFLDELRREERDLRLLLESTDSWEGLVNTFKARTGESA